MSSQSSTFFLWLVPSLGVAVFLARISVWLQPRFSPVVLFPLLTGAALGLALGGLLYLVHLRDPRLGVVATPFVALNMALAEHAFFYLDYRSDFAATLSRNESKLVLVADEVQPVPFIEYMRAHAADSRDVLLWIGNGLLTIIAATGVVTWWAKAHSRRRAAPSGSHEAEPTTNPLREDR
jgi:hypothetical protein